MVSEFEKQIDEDRYQHLQNVRSQQEDELNYIADQEASNLVSQQALHDIELQIQDLATEGKSFGRPSLFKYGFLLFLAILADLVIIGSYLLFGAGILFGLLFASPFIISIIFISWLTDTKLKMAQNYPEKAEGAVNHARTKIILATKAGLNTAKYLRKVPGMKGVARTIPRTMVKIRKTARMSRPLGRILVGTGANSAPFLNLIPFQVFSVLFAYSAEKKTFEEARQAGSDAIGQLQMEAETV